MHFGNVVMGKLTATALETAYKLTTAQQSEIKQDSEVARYSRIPGFPQAKNVWVGGTGVFPKPKDSRAFICEQMVTHFGFQNILILWEKATQWLLPSSTKDKYAMANAHPTVCAVCALVGTSVPRLKGALLHLCRYLLPWWLAEQIIPGAISTQAFFKKVKSLRECWGFISYLYSPTH